MNRIDATFDKLRGAGRAALIPYITAGDPSLAATVPLMRALTVPSIVVLHTVLAEPDPWQKMILDEVISAASAIAVGTYAGGWRIIRTLGSRIIKMDPAQGFAAQGSGGGEAGLADIRIVRR